MRPLLRVVRGEPSDEELAALATLISAAAVLAAAARADDQPPSAVRPARRSAWADRSALMRRTPYPGPGAWRASAMPR